MWKDGVHFHDERSVFHFLMQFQRWLCSQLYVDLVCVGVWPAVTRSR